jgi:hypothetical protein
MNLANKTSLACIPLLVIVCSVNLQAGQSQQSEKAAQTQPSKQAAGGAQSGASAFSGSSSSFAGSMARPSVATGISSWSAGQENFGTANQREGIWRDGSSAVGGQGSVLRARSRPASGAMLSALAARNGLQHNNEQGSEAAKAAPTSAHRSTAAKGTAHTSPQFGSGIGTQPHGLAPRPSGGQANNKDSKGKPGSKGRGTGTILKKPSSHAHAVKKQEHKSTLGSKKGQAGGSENQGGSLAVAKRPGQAK